MKINKIVPLTLFAFILLFQTSASAQWTKSPGEYYAKASIGGTFGNQAFDLDGELVPSSDFSLFDLGFYGELGIIQGASLNATAGVGYATIGEEKTPYITPIMFGVNNQLYLNDHLAIASLVRVGLNAGVNDSNLSKDSLLTFRTATELAFIGEGLLKIGLNFNRFFSSLSGGARYHTAYGVDIISKLLFGYSFASGLVPTLSINFNHSVDKPTVINVPGSGPTRYLGVGLGLGWWMNKHTGLLVELASAPFAISNTGAPILRVGVQFR